MRKISYFLILCAVLGVSSCSKSETFSEEESKKQVNVAFLAHPDVIVTTGTRAAAKNFTDPKKFSFYAFKKKGQTYSFAKEFSDAEATYDGSTWNSSKSQLAVGTYRFLALYNVGDRQTLSEMESLTNKSWKEIQDGIVFKQVEANADVDEFFSGETKEDVQITGAVENKIVVAFDALKRVTSRIDIKFIKVATDGTTEVMYSGTNTIFGAENNLAFIKQTISGLANKYSLGTPLTDCWATDCAFSFEPVGSLVTIGASLQNSTFPKSDEKDMDSPDPARITKGGAYFRGAYVLPFMTANAELDKVLIYLKGGAAADGEVSDRTITATEKDNQLEVKKNYVTLITVKLMSSTAAPGTNPDDAIPGGDGSNGTGKDEEHLFNPTVKFTVTVDVQYSGVINSDVEVE